MRQQQIQTILLVLIIVGSVMAFTTNSYTPVHSIYNEEWNGTSNYRYALENQFNYSTSRILVSPLILQSNDNISVMIIIGSDRKYADAEVASYKKFVENGGSLIIFEDFGPARSVAAQFGVSFLSGKIKETHPSLYVNRPSQFFILDTLIPLFFPDISLAPLLGSDVAGVFDLQGFQFGTTIPLLVSYPSAFLDINDDDILDKKDIKFDFGIPIALFKKFGSNNGSIAVIGDSSIPMNQYWDREITIVNPETFTQTVFTLSNAFWVSMITAYIANGINATNIVFDESHQSTSITSASGVLNLVAGTFVGLVNTTSIALLFLLVSSIITSVKMRKRLRSVVKRRKHQKIVTKENQFISRPNLAEKSISEQYIMYQTMGDGFIHVANSHLIKQIENTGKGIEFLKQLRNEYGQSFHEANSFEELLKLQKKLQEFVEINKNKLL